MEIRPFAIERFYERWEFSTEFMLSSSDCESMTVAELLAFEADAQRRLGALRLGYTEVSGSDELRAVIADGHGRIEPQDVLVLAAAEEGIFLTYHGLLGPGDHAVVESPCYGSAVEVARSTGAQVSLWQRRYEDGWAHDLDELERLLRSDTKLIYVNTPHNPTGAQMSDATFARVVELARERSAVLFSDEVYAGLEHAPDGALPSACDVYERAISLNTVSKAYGLPGLRTGWLCCRDGELLSRIRELKLYTTICSSAPSELLAALALRHASVIVERNRRLVLDNLPLVDDFIATRSDLFEWIRPTAGPIGFPRIVGAFDVQGWCERIASEASVLLLPGAVYEQPRHVRVGFGRANLADALDRIDDYLD